MNDQVTNNSKILPVEYKVLIEPEVVEGRTKGGIELPESVKEKEEMAQIKGVLIAIGGNAFEDWKDRPKIGDKVYFGKYAGLIVDGNDGKKYRLCNDKDICAIIEGS